MKAKYIVAIVLMCLAVTFLGSLAFAQPPGYEEEKEFGAWTDEHWGTIIIGAESQMVVYLDHGVDVGGPPTPDDIPILQNAGYMMGQTGGFQMGFYAINNRLAPMSDPVFRKAIAYCIDKDTIYPTVYGPLVTPIYNWAPPAQAYWCNPDVTNAMPRFDQQMAIDTLIGGGYTPVLIDSELGAVPLNIDHWHMPGGTTDMRDLEQGCPVEFTLALQLAVLMEADFQEIGLPIHHTPLPFNYIIYQTWLVPPYLGWDLTIGIALTFGVDPVFDVMYHSDAIPFANIWGLENDQVDAYIDASMTTLEWEVAKQNIWDCEVLLSEIMPFIPTSTSQGWSMCTGPYDGEPGVLGYVIMEGYGAVNTANDIHRLYGRRQDEETGNMLTIANWMMTEDAGTLNPLVSDTAFEYRIMGSAITGLYQRHPYTHELIPWCAADYPVIELWNGTHTAAKEDLDFTDPTADPSPVGSPGFVIGEKQTWTLRDDMTWHDGEPVEADDCEFLFDLLVNQNNERYDSVHKWIHDVQIVSTYVFEVYYTARYLWADNDVGGLALLCPKHVWGPYIDGDDNILWTVDDEDHRFWDGTAWTDAYGYSAPKIETATGEVQLTHFIGNGYNVYEYGGWQPGVSFHLHRWANSWHFTRILRGDNNFDGLADVLDLWAPLWAYGTQPGMTRWLFQADQANPSGLIDGRDIEVVYNDWGYYWYPSSTLP